MRAPFALAKRCECGHIGVGKPPLPVSAALLARVKNAGLFHKKRAALPGRLSEFSRGPAGYCRFLIEHISKFIPWEINRPTGFFLVPAAALPGRGGTRPPWCGSCSPVPA